MPDDLPENPLGELAVGAIQLHEIYRSYIAAGFTNEQAFELSKTILVTTLKLGQGGDAT
jgi:hypothetical protein